MVRDAAPVFLTVTTCAAVAVPTEVEAKLSEVALSVTTGTGATPVPARLTVWGVVLRAVITLTVALRVPAATGLKMTETVQLEEAARLVAQVVVYE